MKLEYRAISQDEYISHHGVKGMRWGHRKDNRSVGSTLRGAVSSIKKSRSDRQQKKYDRLRERLRRRSQKNQISKMESQLRNRKRKVSVYSMTDEELDAALSRRRKELEYMRMNEKPQKVSVGKKLLQAVGKGILAGVTKSSSNATSELLTNMYDKYKKKNKKEETTEDNG